MLTLILLFVLILLILFAVYIINKTQTNDEAKIHKSLTEKVRNLRRVRPLEQKVCGSYLDVMMAKEDKPTTQESEKIGVEQEKGGYKFMFNDYEGRTAPNTAKRTDYRPCSMMQNYTLRDGYH